MVSLVFSGCGKQTLLNPKDPVTLNLWHNFGGQMNTAMTDLIDEFNATVGLQQGIIINVTSISGSAALHEKLTMAANGDPGAPELPDITTLNPKTAVILSEKGLLVDLKEQFSDDELSAYVPRFIEEGMLEGESLYIFPISKSTEVLILNNTVFSRFAQETGASLDDLKTFEGLVSTAQRYYDWTNAKTPEIPTTAKRFL
jgi:multiple sugar transport system substrate-binding protein